MTKLSPSMKRFLAFAPLLLLHVPALAQEAEAEPNECELVDCYSRRVPRPEEIPVLVTAADYKEGIELLVVGLPLYRSIGDAAYATTSMPVVGLRIEDSLRGVSGLTQFRRTDARSANATSQGATLRGLGGNASSRALLLLDGVPQTDPFGGWVTWPAFAPERLRFVNVTRGGGSGSAGPGALAGTIEFESINGRLGKGLSASALYGSRNSVEANALLSGELGAGSGFITASYARGDGFVPIVAGQRGPADIAAPYRQLSVAARAVVPMGDQTELQASALAFHDRRTRGTILSGNGGDGADASIRIVHRGDWQWQALGYVQLRKFQSRFVAIDAARANVTQTVDQFNVPSTGLGGRFELRPPIGELLELRIGGDVRRTVGETNEFFTYVAGRPTRGREAGGRAITAGSFAELSAKLDQFTLTGGGRIDHWSIADGRLIERTLATGALIRNEIAPKRQGWEPTGRAGIAYQAGPLALRAAGYLGWRLPTLNELYRPFRVGADATAANAALRPERMKGVEIGIDAEPSSDLELSATLFVNRLTSAIANVTLANGPGTFPGVGFVAAGGVYRQRLNIDAIRARGVELEASYRKDDWRAQASYAYTDAQLRTSGLALALNGLRPAQVPAHMASVTLGWKGLSATARYSSAQFEDDQNVRRLDDALTLDVAAEVPLGKGLSLLLRGENVADARVEAAISGVGIVERAGPKTMWIGLKLKPEAK